MKLTEIFKSSLATLKMNGRRTFLTMFGIIIGIASVITILSLGNGFQKQTLDELAKDEKGRPNQVFSYTPTNTEINWDKLKPFTEELFKKIEEFNGVDEVKFSSQELSTVKQTAVTFSNKDRQFYGVDTADSTSYQMIKGRNLTEADSDSLKRYAIIDSTVADTLFGGADEALHKPVQIDDKDYTVVGVYETLLSPEVSAETSSFGGPQIAQLVIPKKTKEALTPTQDAEFSISVYFKPGTEISSISRKINEFLKEHGPEKDNGTYEYFDTSELMKQIGNQLNMITYFIGSVAGISLFIAGVGVMNMMYISVSERTNEIGIRRSLGATRGSIQLQFLLEGISITTIGGMIGYGIGVGIAIIVGNFLPFKALLDTPTAMISVGISVGIGIIFSVFPARTAARKNLVEILR